MDHIASDGDVCLLPLERFGGVLRSLGPAVARCVALEEVSVPVRSALALAFPKAKYVGVQLLVGNGVYVSVGNFLEQGSTTATLLQADRSLTGLAVAQRTAVSASYKKGGPSLADVAYVAEKFGATQMTTVPLVSSGPGPESWDPLDALIESFDEEDGASRVMDTCAEALRGGECIGTVSVAVDAAEMDTDVAYRHLKNSSMLAVSVAPHSVGEALRLINDVASLVGITQPGRSYEYVPGIGHKELDAPASSSWNFTGEGTFYTAADASSTAGSPGPVPSEDLEAELQYSDLDEEYIRELQDDVTDDEEMSSSVGTACHTDDLSDFDDFDGAPPCPLINLHAGLEGAGADSAAESAPRALARAETAAGPVDLAAASQQSSAAAAADGGQCSGSCGGDGRPSSVVPHAPPSSSKAPSPGSGFKQSHASGVTAPGGSAEALEAAALLGAVGDDGRRAESMHWLLLTFASAMLEQRFALQSRHMLRWALALLLAPFVCRSLAQWSPIDVLVGPYTPLLCFLAAHTFVAWTWLAHKQYRSVIMAEYVTALMALTAYQLFPTAAGLTPTLASANIPALPAMWRLCRAVVALLSPLAMARLSLQAPMLCLATAGWLPLAMAPCLAGGDVATAAASVARLVAPCLLVPLALSYVREWACRKLFIQELRAAAAEVA